MHSTHLDAIKTPFILPAAAGSGANAAAEEPSASNQKHRDHLEAPATSSSPILQPQNTKALYALIIQWREHLQALFHSNHQQLESWATQKAQHPQQSVKQQQQPPSSGGNNNMLLMTPMMMPSPATQHLLQGAGGGASFPLLPQATTTTVSQQVSSGTTAGTQQNQQEYDCHQTLLVETFLKSFGISLSDKSSTRATGVSHNQQQPWLVEVPGRSYTVDIQKMVAFTSSSAAAGTSTSSPTPRQIDAAIASFTTLSSALIRKLQMMLLEKYHAHVAATTDDNTVAAGAVGGIPPTPTGLGGVVADSSASFTISPKLSFTTTAATTTTTTNAAGGAPSSTMKLSSPFFYFPLFVVAGENGTDQRSDDYNNNKDIDELLALMTAVCQRVQQRGLEWRREGSSNTALPMWSIVTEASNFTSLTQYLRRHRLQQLIIKQRAATTVGTSLLHTGTAQQQLNRNSAATTSTMNEIRELLLLQQWENHSTASPSGGSRASVAKAWQACKEGARSNHPYDNSTTRGATPPPETTTAVQQEREAETPSGKMTINTTMSTAVEDAERLLLTPLRAPVPRSLEHLRDVNSLRGTNGGATISAFEGLGSSDNPKKDDHSDEVHFLGSSAQSSAATDNMLSSLHQHQQLVLSLKDPISLSRINTPVISTWCMADCGDSTNCGGSGWDDDEDDDDCNDEALLLDEDATAMRHNSTNNKNEKKMLRKQKKEYKRHLQAMDLDVFLTLCEQHLRTTTSNNSGQQHVSGGGTTSLFSSPLQTTTQGDSMTAGAMQSQFQRGVSVLAAPPLPPPPSKLPLVNTSSTTQSHSHHQPGVSSLREHDFKVVVVSGSGKGRGAPAPTMRILHAGSGYCGDGNTTDQQGFTTAAGTAMGTTSTGFGQQKTTMGASSSSPRLVSKADSFVTGGATAAAQNDDDDDDLYGSLGGIGSATAAAKEEGSDVDENDNGDHHDENPTKRLKMEEAEAPGSSSPKTDKNKSDAARTTMLDSDGFHHPAPIAMSPSSGAKQTQQQLSGGQQQHNSSNQPQSKMQMLFPCPVCGRPIPLDSLVIDDLTMSLLQQQLDGAADEENPPPRTCGRGYKLLQPSSGTSNEQQQQSSPVSYLVNIHHNQQGRPSTTSPQTTSFAGTVRPHKYETM